MISLPTRESLLPRKFSLSLSFPLCSHTEDAPLVHWFLQCVIGNRHRLLCVHIHRRCAPSAVAGVKLSFSLALHWLRLLVSNLKSVDRRSKMLLWTAGLFLNHDFFWKCVFIWFHLALIKYERKGSLNDHMNLMHSSPCILCVILHAWCGAQVYSLLLLTSFHTYMGLHLLSASQFIHSQLRPHFVSTLHRSM